MTKIHMETEHVRETAHLLSVASGEFHPIPSQLRGLAGSITSAWQGGGASRYASELRRLADSLQQEVGNLQQLAGRVGNEVNEWEQVDFAFGSVVSEITGNVGEGTPWWGFSEGIRSTVEELGTIYSGLSTAGVIMGMSGGASYAGQVIFHGGQGLKEAAGLSSHLTHIKAANLPRHLASQSKIGGLEIGMAAWQFANEAGEDWEAYDDGSEKATALGIDAIFVTGKTLITHYAAHAVATFAVGALVTAGAPAVGVAAAGLAIWWGASYLIGGGMDMAYNWAETSGAKDSLVKSGGSLLDDIGNGIQETAQSIDRVFDPTIQRTAMSV